jgi:hypothetical protein
MQIMLCNPNGSTKAALRGHTTDGFPHGRVRKRPRGSFSTERQATVTEKTARIRLPLSFILAWHSPPALRETLPLAGSFDPFDKLPHPADGFGGLGRKWS